MLSPSDSLIQDSTIHQPVVTPQKDLLDDPDISEPVRYNPLVSAGLSAFVPGCGQLYCRKPVRGLLFMATEAMWLTYTINRFNNYRSVLDREVDYYASAALAYQDSLRNLFTPDLDVHRKYYAQFIDAHLKLDLAQYRRNTGRYTARLGAGWTIGIYLWNIADALHCSQTFHDNNPRNPAVAAWLSAIPCLGLGQIYNGSLTKAGLVWTTQTMLTFMAFSNNNLMNDCITKRHQIESSVTIDNSQKQPYLDQWDDEYNTAFRKRNTYLWYMVIFYFYGIFDAAVDAHLHDYRFKTRLKPQLETDSKSIQLKMIMDF